MWNTVCSNFEGETVNFGPRNELLGGTELYEVRTLHTISAGVDRVPVQPLVQAVATCDHVAIAIENVVNVMRHQTTVLSREFESTVDSIALRSDLASGGVLLVGERCGNLHVIVVESSQIVSFPLAKTLADSDMRIFRSIEVHKTDNDDYTISVLAGENLIIATISDEILSLLGAAPTEPDLSLLQVRWVNLGQKLIANGTVFPSVAARWVDDDLLVFSDPGDLFCVPIGEERGYRLLTGLSELGVLKMFVVHSDCSLLVLTAENELLIFCLKTLIIKRIWRETKIEDFMLTEDAALSSNAGTDQGLKIAVVTVPSEDMPHRMEIHRYPTLELLYSLEVVEFCRLVAVCHDREDFCIVEGTAEELQGDITELRVRVVSEALPEQRLASLIAKRKFVEAEEFAIHYQLALEEVHWSHLLFILDDLSCSRQTALDETSERARLEEAYSLIRKLPDVLGVARCCVETFIATPSAFIGLFLFLQEHLSAAECPDCAERDALCAQIAFLLNRAATCRLLYPNPTADQWLSFAKADLVEEIGSCFRKEDVPSAMLIWARHQDQFVTDLNCDALLCLLNAVPSTIQMSVLVEWLEESFLPCVLRNVPEAVEGVCAWIVSRALGIEVSNKAAWPSGAVRLLEVVPNVYDRMTSDEDILPPKTWLTVYSAPRMIQKKESALSTLYYLLTDLRDLEVLWTKHKCRVTLQELQNRNSQEAVFSILDEVVTKTEVNTLLEGFLTPYLKKKGLDVSETLSNYVEYILRYHDVLLLQEALWEEKLLAVAAFIRHPTYWLKVVVKILGHAPVPWSKGIEELAVQGSLLKGSAIQEIETERKRMQVNVILQRYDMKFLKCTQLSNARVLVRNILLSEKPAALEDALTVARSTGNLTELDVCLFHMERLLLKGDIDKFADALHSVPPNSLGELGPRMAMFGRLHLSRSLASYGSKAEELLECWRYLLNVLDLKQETKPDDYSLMQNHVLQIIVLWRDYKIKVSTAKLESTRGRLDMLQECLQVLVSQGSAEDDNTRGISRRLLHLADVLKLDVQSALEALIIKTLELSRDDLLLVFCDHLLEVSCIHSSVLETLQKILCESKDVLRVVSRVHQLACRVSVTVEGSLLTRCTQILMWASVLMQILEACDATVVSPPRLTDPYQTWKQRRMYRRQGIVLDSAEICSSVSDLGRAMWQLFLEDKIELLAILQKNIEVLCKHFFLNYQEELCLSMLITIERVFDTSQHKTCMQDAITAMRTQAHDALSRMLTRATAQNHPDMVFLKSLLVSVGSEQAGKTLQSLFRHCKSNFRLLKELAMVCCEVSDPRMQEHFKTVLKIACWGHRLARSSICFAEAIEGDRTALENVLTKMIKCLSVSTEDIVNYCSSFSLNSESALVGRLEFLLCTQAEEDFLQGRLLSKSLAGAAVVLEALPKASALKAVKKALSKVNSYCYEVFQFGYDYLHSCQNQEEHGSSVQRELNVLQFLTSYRRYGSPSQEEMDAWYDEHPLVDLPAISQTRLPFHLILQPSWTFINNEIHTDTASAWLDIADTLRLDKDDIRFMAVSNAVVFWSCQKHRGSILDVGFLVSIKSLMSEMSNVDKFLACVGMVLKKLPKGPTAVKVAETCADLPISRLGHSSKEAKDRKKKFARLYMQLRNEQTLKHHGLDTPLYLGLCSRTEQLLEKLLECNAWHSLFADTSHVYSCLSEIAEGTAPSSLVFHTIVEQKVGQWLQCCAPESALDQTSTTVTFEASAKYDEGDTSNLVTIIHLIQHIPHELEDLLSEILSVENSPLGLQRQGLARRCLLAGLGDLEGLAIRMSELSVDSYRVRLQSLGVPMVTQELNKQSATELAKSLLSSNCPSREILRVVSALFLEFDVQLSSVWGALLSSAIRLNAVDVLCHALPIAGRLPLLWQSSEFSHAWRCVLLAPSRLFKARTDERSLLHASLALRCPTVHRLPLTLLADNYRSEGGILFLVVCTLLRGAGNVAREAEEVVGSLPATALETLQGHKDHFFMNLLHIRKVMEKI